MVRSRAIDAQRADSRRVTREQHVARSKTAPSVEDLASQVEMHRVVAEAVGELPMPYRAVVLLRYFESLTPQEIAERFDAPAATIRTRLRRAHEMLRHRLAQAFDGDQARMRGVLLLVASAPPIAVPGGATAGGGVGGVVAMGAGKKVAAVALLVALGLMGLALLHQDADPRAEPDNADTLLLAEAAEPFGTPTTPALEGRDGAAGSLAEAKELPREATPGELLVRGRVVDASRRPVAGASVALVTTNKATAVARSDMAGRFSFPAGLLPTRWAGISFPLVRVQAGNGTYAYRGIQLTPDQPHVTDVGTLVLSMGLPLHVDVVGPDGPVAEARVAVMGVFLDTPGATHAYAFTQTDAAGRATFRGLPGKQLRVVVTAPGLSRQVSAVVLPLAVKGRLFVELSSERLLEVLVVDSGTGLPIAGVEVGLWEEMRSTRFGPRGTAPFRPRLEIPVTDENGRTHIRGLGRNGRLAVVAQAE